jgi:hypothetical protein
MDLLLQKRLGLRRREVEVVVDAARGGHRLLCADIHLQRIEVAPVPLEGLEHDEILRILIAPTKPLVDVSFGTRRIVDSQQPFTGLLKALESGALVRLFIGTHDCTLFQASVAE